VNGAVGSRFDPALHRFYRVRRRGVEADYAGRTLEMKKAFFKKIADDLHAQLNVRRDDVVINLVAKENWSFGGGIAQYAK
jgi:Tautomerase enzyme